MNVASLACTLGDVLFLNNSVKKKWDDLFTVNRFNQSKYPKSYKHFDRPVSKSKAYDLVASPKTINKHSFLPFIYYEKKVRKYRGKRHRIRLKKRPIMYASHKDGLIYSYYTILLSQLYEDKLHKLGINNCVTAYRPAIGNNIKFANDAFQEIQRRKNCAAIAIDISSFFDNIDHENLKKEWCSLLGEKRLPDDHFKVYKSITKWSRVDRDECYTLLNINKNKVPSPICSPEKFRNKIRAQGLITVNKDAYGVPQGSPISAFLANLYMLPFDQEMHEITDHIGGYYRRYSDDILWICDVEDKDKILSSVDKALTKRGSELKRSTEKTEITVFNRKDEGEQISYSIVKGGKHNYQKPFQYLGFTFDGKNKLIRSQTLGRFHRRIRYAVRAAKRSARKHSNPKIFRNSLNQKLTHLGKGNFITTYVKNASVFMESESIKKQVSGSYQRVTKELDKKGRRK